MPRIKKSLLADLTTVQLKKLLAARKQIDVLEKRKNQLTRELAAVDKELAKLMSGLTGSAAPARKKAKKKKALTKKTARKKPVRRKASAARKAGAPKATLEEVVARLIGKKGSALPFKEISAAITKGKLFATKSKNFDNVLRRTLSTSKKIKRVGRGLYDVR